MSRSRRSSADLVALDQGLIDWIADAMEAIGTVTMRHMMGGTTLYCDGTVFAIVAADALWVTADKFTDTTWDETSCVRFTYKMNGKTGSMNYRRAPNDVYDDADELRIWGALELEAGRRAPGKVKPQERKL